MPKHSILISIITCLTLFAVPPSLAGGASGEIWAMDREELEARLRAGDHEFLRHLDFSGSGRDGLAVEEVGRLGDEAMLMLGYSYIDLGLPRVASRFLRAAWKDSLDPWSRYAARELMDLLAAGEQWADLEGLAREALRRYPREPAFARGLANALYRLERDTEVLALINEHDGISGTEDEAAETALWQAVSGSRLNLPGWRQSYRSLFSEHPATSAHGRVWVYLLAQPDIYSEFDPLEIAIFDAKRLLSEGRFADSVDRFAQVAAQVVESGEEGGPASRVFLTSTSLRDFYLAGSLSGRQTRTAGQLAAIAGRTPGHLAGYAREYAGRLHRTAGNYRDAVENLEASLSSSDGEQTIKRRSWYLVSSMVRMNPVGAAAAIHAVVPTLTDPPYFDDVFAELLGLLTERREWESVLQAYQALSDFATHGVLAAYEVVLAEAVANSLLKTSAERRTDLRDMYLNRAAAQREDVFSALLAATLLGEDGLDVLLDAADRELTGAPDYSEQQADFIRALMRFGLFDRAYGAAMEDTSLVDITTLADLADELSRAGRPRQSIQLAIRTPAEDPSSRAFRQMLLRRYPLAYAGIFESVLTDEPVDRWLLYGLVRSESLFDADAVSSAGAVGLAQLLGPTAEDVARRMRLDTPVLTDPLDNLRIGARYVSMLTEQFGSRLKALMAYNAGPGRVRSWESRVPDLDGILFHRAVPFQETYNHVRNVVVSTSYYNYLYADRAPADTVRFLFGDTLTPLVK